MNNFVLEQINHIKILTDVFNTKLADLHLSRK